MCMRLPIPTAPFAPAEGLRQAARSSRTGRQRVCYGGARHERRDAARYRDRVDAGRARSPAATRRRRSCRGADPPARPRRRRVRPALGARRARSGAAAGRADAGSSAAGTRRRTLVVPRPARRLSGSGDLPRDLRAADGVPRRLARRAGPELGPGDPRRVLDGLRHVLRDRPGPWPTLPRRDPRDERLHPDRRGLGARARTAAGSPGVHHARRARPGDQRRVRARRARPAARRRRRRRLPRARRRPSPRAGDGRR